MQKDTVTLFKQTQNGCNKDLCFGRFCKKNPYCTVGTDNKAILLQIARALQGPNKQDPEDLICSNITSINLKNIDELSDDNIMDTFDDVYQFSCSFVPTHI